VLTHPDGIQLDEATAQMFKNKLEHDPADLVGARTVAAHEGEIPIGLFYRNDAVERYDDVTVEGLATSRAEKVEALRELLDRHRV
jgi:hypothetical protein